MSHVRRTRSLVFAFGCLLLMGGPECAPYEVAELQRQPIVEIVTPEDGSSLGPGPVALELVIHESDRDRLSVTWTSDQDGVLWSGLAEDGQNKLTTGLSTGNHVITAVLDEWDSFDSIIISTGQVEDTGSP